MVRELHRSIRNTPYKLRAQGKCVRQVLKQRRRLKTACAYLVLSEYFHNNVPYLHITCSIISIIYFLLYNHHKRILYDELRWRWRPPARINNLDTSFCWHNLRFRKEDLFRLSNALLFPLEFQLDNGSWTTNEEMLIVLLLRLSSSTTWIKLESIINIELSRLSRVFKVL